MIALRRKKGDGTWLAWHGHGFIYQNRFGGHGAFGDVDRGSQIVATNAFVAFSGWDSGCGEWGSGHVNCPANKNLRSAEGYLDSFLVTKLLQINAWVKIVRFPPPTFAGELAKLAFSIRLLPPDSRRQLLTPDH